MGRSGLLTIEGFSIRARFDPDRRRQRAAVAAAKRQFLFKFGDPLSPGVGWVHASDRGVALHRMSLQAHWPPGLFNTTLRSPDGPAVKSRHRRRRPARSVIPPWTTRTANKAYRTTPLRALWQHAPYSHDGSAATLADVVAHYNRVRKLGLTADRERDLVEYLKSL